VAGLALNELNAAVLELRSLLEELGEDPDSLLESLVAEESSADDEEAVA
jgi:hypothetical protein